MPTIREVARRAGVSTSTVSHFLNKTKTVGPELQTRILDAMHALGYRQANTVARSLRSGQTGSIGVILDDIGGARHNPILKGISTALNELGLGLMLRSSGGDWSKEAEHIENLIGYQVDGLILSSTGAFHHGYARLARYKIPAIALGNTPRALAPGPHLGILRHSGREGAGAVAAHLSESGHRAAGLIGPDTEGVLDGELRESFRLACNRFSIPAVYVATAASTGEGGRHALFQMLRNEPSPTALFVTDPRLLTGVLNGLFDLGLHCPREISLVAFGDIDWADAVDPPLTVLVTDDFEVGRRSVAMLRRLMTAAEPIGTLDCLPTHLICRESVGHRGG